nr:helix-turn-helix transcriptional regulator [Gammaproteobacteria bacterium]
MGATRDEALRSLYGAAMGTGNWPEALDALAGLAQSHVVTLDTYGRVSKDAAVLAANVVPDPGIEEYNREYGHGNFQIERVAPHFRAGKAVRTSDFISQRELLQSDLYNHVYRPMGIRYAAGAPMEVTDQRIVEFSFMKAIDAGDHTDRDIRRIQALVTHLQQAWAGYSHLMQLEESLNTLTRLWDCFAHAVIVIDARLRIRFANRAAEILLAARSGWADRFGTLHRCACGGDAMLKQAVTDMTEGRGDVVSLAGPAAPGSYAPLVTLYRLNKNRIALVMTDPTAAASDLRPALRARFDLTAAEADLIDALIAGQSLRQIAEEREIRYETARAHLKNAMQKNGWRRQGEMIAEILKALLPAGQFHSRDD